MSERRCASYEGCMGTGVLDDLSDSGSGRTVYCDCAAGRELMDRESRPLIDGHGYLLGNHETLPERAERLASRYTRYDGSPR